MAQLYARFSHLGPGTRTTGLPSPAEVAGVASYRPNGKLIGAALRQDLLPLSECLLLVSGRAGFELVQKSVIAGAAVLAAVGAPTSLSVELAEEAGMTLVGFLRNGQFNIYSFAERISF